jgi:hypothetical protein
MLHWLDDPLPAFKRAASGARGGRTALLRHPRPGYVEGVRAAAQKVGAGDTAKRFLDMHDLGDMLVTAGFGDPVMDMEMVTLTYPTPRAFLADQRHLGVRDALLGHQGWHDWRRLFGAWPQDDEGRLPASFEIVHGHAWKPEPRQVADGRAVMKFHRDETRETANPAIDQGAQSPGHRSAPEKGRRAPTRRQARQPCATESRRATTQRRILRHVVRRIEDRRPGKFRSAGGLLFFAHCGNPVLHNADSSITM